MTNQITQPIEIEEADLDNANGGLLLPAVQKVREAAARSQASGDVSGDGVPDLVVAASPAGRAK